MIHSLSDIVSKPLMWIHPNHLHRVNKSNTVDKVADKKYEEEIGIKDTSGENKCFWTCVGYTSTGIFISYMGFSEECYVTGGFGGLMAAAGLFILASDMCSDYKNSRNTGIKDKD